MRSSSTPLRRSDTASARQSTRTPRQACCRLARRVRLTSPAAKPCTDARGVRAQSGEHGRAARTAEAVTERLADIGARIDGVRQLGAVVNAIRGIATSSAQQARTQLAAVNFYAANVATATGWALALAPLADGTSKGGSGRLALVHVLRRAGLRRCRKRPRAGHGWHSVPFDSDALPRPNGLEGPPITMPPAALVQSLTGELTGGQTRRPLRKSV